MERGNGQYKNELEKIFPKKIKVFFKIYYHNDQRKTDEESLGQQQEGYIRTIQTLSMKQE